MDIFHLTYQPCAIHDLLFSIIQHYTCKCNRKDAPCILRSGIDDSFCPPCFDEQIYYDESMPPIYDDYIHESGFGEVMTLFSDEYTILEEVAIDYDNKLLSMMIMVMTCMLY